MYYTPTQLDIIREFGSKELSFGCRLESKVSAPDCVIVDDFPGKGGYSIFYDYGLTVLGLIKYDEIGRNYTILGHEPHLEDVFRVNRERFNGYMEVSDFRLKQTRGGMPLWQDIPYNPNLQLLSQPEETLKELLSLFK